MFALLFVINSLPSYAFSFEPMKVATNAFVATLVCVGVGVSVTVSDCVFVCLFVILVRVIVLLQRIY